ncbi:MAG: UDP-N-acetylmuramate--L-alanine ligase [Planctomycetes bacterium]|nr:UDP-N-acetylmuramate--L-alanine ligase [Planctomycetota bacterium]
MKLSQLRHVHFVGMGGAGVSGLARIALQAGARVTGTDLVDNPTLRSLGEAGAIAHVGHHRDHIPADCQLVVASAAIKKANPEYREAQRRGIRIMKYAEALGEFTQGHTNLCIAGTHGKTTTTAMLAQMMVGGGKDPGYLIGGEPASLPAASAAGTGVNFVIESCEYDRSFLRLHPSVIVLNNIELDHMDVYGDLDGVTKGFIEFAQKLPARGTLFYNADDDRCCEVARKAGCNAIGFGESAAAVWRLHDIDASSGFATADVTCRGMQVGRMKLQVPGRVNAMNALGALAAANWAGIPVYTALKALQNFGGVKRRFEVVGSVGGVPLVDDYAHHPTAVKQLLETARATFINRRVVAVFQAHQYQRILTFFDQFADCLKLADRVLIARTYAARETGVQPGEPEERLARWLRQNDVDAMAYGDFGSVVNDLSAKLTPADVAVFIGAGDVNEIAFELLRRREVISTRLRAVKPAEVAA